MTTAMTHPSYLIQLLLVVSFLLSGCNPQFSRLSKEENRYELTTEPQLADETYSNEIEAFYDSGIEGNFTGKADVEIYYKIFQQPNADRAILISTGRTEAAIKYKELVFDLYRIGFSVYIHDHRGQGKSGRMTEDGEMGYIDVFQHYIDDMKYFRDAFVQPRNYNKVYLLTHSMGGAIGMTYLEQHPDDFDAAAFSSPMLGLKPGICGVVKVLVGDKPKYAIGESKYEDDKVRFEGNTLTGSELRYNRMVQAFSKEPQARLGGATYQWLNESCKQFEYMFDNIESIETPFILFSAENEQIVYPGAHQRFIADAQKLNKACIAYEITDAKHELLIEKDKARIETINQALDFFNKY